MSTTGSKATRQITRAAGVVMVGFVLSSLTGLVSLILISRTYGTGDEIDAFYAANRLTEIIFNLMAGGALASAFIPTFTSFLSQSKTTDAWRLASAIANLISILLGLVAFLAWLTAPWLVQNILAPGFEDPTKVELTVSLLRTMLISTLIFGLSGLLMGILNAHQHFALPALAPAMYRLGLIVGVEVLAPRIGIHGLGWGVVLGSALHLAIQLPGLIRIGGRYWASLGLRMVSVRQVGRLMAPRLVGVAVVQINFLVNTILASGMTTGSVAAISIAFAVMLMPQVIIGQGFAIASLPTFSAQAARGSKNALRSSISNTLLNVVFLALPASLGLVLLRRPVVGLMLQRGVFDAQSTEQVAWALLWYAVGLVGHAALEIIARAFYALKDTRTPVVVGAIAMSLNIAFSLVFSAGFAQIGWAPHGGLALANSLATGLEVVVLVWLLRRVLGGLGVDQMGRRLSTYVTAAVLMGASLWMWLNLMADKNVFVLGGGGVVLGAGVYWVTSLLLGAPEARQLPVIFLRRGNEIPPD